MKPTNQVRSLQGLKESRRVGLALLQMAQELLKGESHMMPVSYHDSEYHMEFEWEQEGQSCALSMLALPDKTDERMQLSLFDNDEYLAWKGGSDGSC